MEVQQERELQGGQLQQEGELQEGQLQQEGELQGGGDLHQEGPILQVGGEAAPQDEK